MQAVYSAIDPRGRGQGTFLTSDIESAKTIVGNGRIVLGATL